MKNFNTCFFLVLGIFFMPLSVGAQVQKEPLYQALETTYHNNPTIQAARAEFSAVQEQLFQAKSGYKPSVNADADLTYTSTEIEGNDFTNTDGGNFSKSLGLSLNQPLYHGGIIRSGVKQAEYLVAAQGFYLSGVEQSTLYDAAVSYMNLYADKAVLALQENNLNLVAKELEQAKTRFEVGELTRTDVSQSEARLAAARAGVINAQASVKASVASFKSLVGGGIPVDIAYPSIQFELPKTLDDALTLAKTNNRQVLRAKLNRIAVQYEIETVRGELLPKLDAVGRLSQSYTPSSSIDKQRQAVVGLNASVPLYTGGTTRSRIRQAQKKLMQSQGDLSAVQNTVEQQVVAAWTAWDAAKAEVQARRSQVEAAKIAREGVGYETEFGERTTLDALNANQELLSAQVDLTQAEKNRFLTQFSLAHNLGLLVPQNLGFSTVQP